MNLYEKILKIAESSGVIKKNKSGFNYKYTTEDEILAKVTAGMHTYGVVLIPSVKPETLKVTPYTYQRWDKKAGKEIPVNEFVVSADMLFTWVNAENPEEKIEIPWIMTAQKDDVSQALGGALTYSNRYFLLKALQIATVEDDPDNYRSKQKEAANYEKTEAIKSLKANILELCKTKIANGYDKDKIYSIIEKVGGVKNPNAINDIDTLNKVFESINTANK